jgi:hypothetical protein
MPCPLFLPGSMRGNFYEGRCTADPERAVPDETLQSCCNSGYARSRCSRAATATADCVQFLIAGESDGVVEVAWSLERDHHPVAVGRANAAKPATGNAVLDAQIGAYALITTRR